MILFIVMALPPTHPAGFVGYWVGLIRLVGYWVGLIRLVGYWVSLIRLVGYWVSLIRCWVGLIRLVGYWVGLRGVYRFGGALRLCLVSRPLGGAVGRFCYTRLLLGFRLSVRGSR
jgi:hypothetical protein